MIRIMFRNESNSYADYAMENINKFFKALKDKDHELFKEVNTSPLIDAYGSDMVIAMVNRNTDWLTNKKYLKDYLLLRGNDWVELMDLKITSNLSNIIEILEKDKGDKKLDLNLPRNMEFDFDLILKNHKWLEIVLSKLKVLDGIFKNVDVNKIPQSFYNNPKHTNAILDTMGRFNSDSNKIITRIPLKHLVSKDIWNKWWELLYSIHKDKYLSLIPTKWWTYEQMYLLINPEIMQKYYDFLVKESKFTSKLIVKGHRWIVDCIKDEDLHYIKDVIKKIQNNKKK